jgi:UDP-N-acetylmuramate--alanine ligase
MKNASSLLRDSEDPGQGRRTTAPIASVLEQASRIHLVGLLGSGVRGLVPILLARGMKVSGSDLDADAFEEKYRGMGVALAAGHSDANLDPSTDVVLISAAVKPDNPEVQAANRKRIPVIKYSEGLGYLMSEKLGIAVAGTHGKTTTTAMISHVLLECGADPSFVIGGEYAAYGGSSRSGKGRHFVAEACEFDRSFLNLRPAAAVITNIEEEHLDYFPSLAEIQKAFADFASLLPPRGLLVINADDEKSRFLRREERLRVETFSLERCGGDWGGEEVVLEGLGSRLRLVARDGRTVEVRLRVPGLHNVRNALAAAAVAAWAGLPLERVAQALGSFTGVRRRFEVLRREPVTVIDDYAHHPTEVDTVLRAARGAYPGRRLIAVFQPHQHSRLRRLLERFAAVLARFDEVLVMNVFYSRDSVEDVRAIDSHALVEAVRGRGKECHDTPEFDDAVSRLDAMVEKGDVVIFLGAGTVTRLAKRYAEHGSVARGVLDGARTAVDCARGD